MWSVFFSYTLLPTASWREKCFDCHLSVCLSVTECILQFYQWILIKFGKRVRLLSKEDFIKFWKVRVSSAMPSDTDGSSANTTAQQALYWDFPGFRRGWGWPRTNWRGVIKKYLQRMGLTWEEAEVAALNRQEWRRNVTQSSPMRSFGRGLNQVRSSSK